MRKTPLFTAVLKILETESIPVSVPELQALLLTQKFTPNKTSLYRLLERLQTENLIETVLLDNKTAFYEIKSEHHHHFVCNECEAIECLADASLENKIHALEHTLEAQGLKITDHQFSFSGQCAQCQ